MSIAKRLFDYTPEGKPVTAYTLERGDVAVTVLDFGGIIQSLLIPDAVGVRADVVCGFDTVQGYLTGGGYHGAIIGRYANRIQKGTFSLGGKTYHLNKNENDFCTLHGGNQGFNVRFWDVEEVQGINEDSLVLTRLSPDGEENFPGNLQVKVTYTLSDKRILRLHYEADTDADTVVNLTNHAYFNLAGYDKGDICSHRITLNADTYAQADENLIATGRALPVENTSYDFRLGGLITGAYDNSFFLNGKSPAVTVTEAQSGRHMELYTNMPSMQFYTGNFLGGDVDFKGGVKQQKHHGFCLETQFAPDSVNYPQFETSVLHPGEHYDRFTEFRF